MHPRSVGRQRGAAVGGRGERIVVDVDRGGRVFGEIAIVRDHHRDRFADIDDLVDRAAPGGRRCCLNAALGNATTSRSVRRSGRRSASVRPPCTPGCARAAARIDAADGGVGVRAAQERRVQHPGHPDVVDEARPAHEQVEILHPGRALAECSGGHGGPRRRTMPNVRTSGRSGRSWARTAPRSAAAP